MEALVKFGRNIKSIKKRTGRHWRVSTLDDDFGRWRSGFLTVRRAAYINDGGARLSTLYSDCTNRPLLALLRNNMTETAAAAPASEPPKAKSPKKKAAGAKAGKPKAKASHPPTAAMVNAAVGSLKERGGSSLQAIKKYISSTYKVDAEKLAPFIRKYIKSAVASGKLVQTKGTGAAGSFKLPGGDDGKKKSGKPKAVKKAAKSPKKEKKAPSKAKKAKKPPTTPKAPKPKKTTTKSAAKPKKPAAKKVVKKPAAKKASPKKK